MVRQAILLSSLRTLTFSGNGFHRQSSPITRYKLCQDLHSRITRCPYSFLSVVEICAPSRPVFDALISTVRRFSFQETEVATSHPQEKPSARFYSTLASFIRRGMGLVHSTRNLSGSVAWRRIALHSDRKAGVGIALRPSDNHLDCPDPR